VHGGSRVGQLLNCCCALLLGCSGPSVPAPRTALPSASPTATHASPSAVAAASPSAVATASSAPATATTSPSPSPVTGGNDYVTVAQLNFWYFGPGCNGGFERYDCSGKRSTPLTPLLGATYVSSDPAVIRQQIDWAHEYGVDAFSIEWTTPRGVPGSLEDTIDDAFLRAPNLGLVRWCIFDDFYLRLDQTPGLNVDLTNGIDFDDPQLADLFVQDFDHFAQKYFTNPQYLTVAGRPVVYVWGTWNARGDIRAAMARAREAAAARGFDVFIVGDIVRTDQFIRPIASAYDAGTNFTFLIPGSPTAANVGRAAANVDAALSQWAADIAGLKVAGRSEHTILQPGFTPQFDNRDFTDNSPIYVPALSKDQVTKMALVARQHSQPASDGSRLIWLNTWNNWAETTTLEPTVDAGPKYPAGNYGFDMVEVVRDVFGQVTFAP
jgi:hypothetical protein